MMSDHLLGVDIGGSGMKAALVDLDAGNLAGTRRRIPTPRPAEPAAMAEVFAELRDHFSYRGPIGCTFPGVIERSAVVRTAANLDDSWVGVDAAALLSVDDAPVTMINDADAAGIAEMRHGAGRGVDGTVVIITIGTGLGTAVFTDGHLVRNTEFGHIEIDGVDAETRAAGRLIDGGLSFREWAPRFDRYLETIRQLLWPSLVILGGGVSKEFDRWSGMLTVDLALVPAQLRNHAGIVGAAMSVA